jgi:hypothetical protein
MMEGIVADWAEREYVTGKAKSIPQNNSRFIAS